METAKLVEACHKGDLQAWNSLVNYFRPKAINWATGFCRNRENAEDIVQESLLIASKHLGDLRNPQAFSHWFYQIVKTQAFRFLNRESQKQTSQLEEISDKTKIDTIVVLKVDFEREFEKLPLELQQVFLFTSIHNWTLKEVATYLNIPEGTVKSRLARARNVLQTNLFEKPEATLNKSGIDIEEILSLLFKRSHITQKEIKEALSKAWESLYSLKFTLQREWTSGDTKKQKSDYKWLSPNWLRIETEQLKIGKVITVIHGNNSRTYFEHLNTIKEGKLPKSADHEFVLEHVWKELIARDDLVVVPSKEDEELWHLWTSSNQDLNGSQGVYEGVHYWIHPEDGIPRKFEVWGQGKCLFQEKLLDIIRNAPIPRNEFNLPKTEIRNKAWNLKDLMGGLPKKVEPMKAIQQCPFSLNGVSLSTIQTLGIGKELEVLKYYKGNEWAIRYGARLGPKEILRDLRSKQNQRKPIVYLSQAKKLNDDIVRHWGLSKLEEPVPELGNEAKSRIVLESMVSNTTLFWVYHNQPFMLNGFEVFLEDLNELAKNIEVIDDQYFKYFII